MAGIYSLRQGQLLKRRGHIPELVAYGVLLVMTLLSLASLTVQSMRLQSVRTNVLAPAVHAGDALIVHKTASSIPTSGDIISYYTGRDASKPQLGRVVLADRSSGTVQVQAGSIIETVPTSQIVGAANARIVGLGRLLDFWHSVAGLIVLVYVPATVIIGCELARLAAHYGPPAYRLRRFAIQ